MKSNKDNLFTDDKRSEVLAKIKEYEQKGLFNEHIDPIDENNYYKVDKNFKYIKTGLEKLKYDFIDRFMVRPYARMAHKKMLFTIIKGRENLQGIKSCIITCNHINKLDCLVVRKGVSGHKLYATAGEFNNQKGKLGELMRAGGMMPMSSDTTAMKNFNLAVGKRLKQNSYVLFYPEQAMWWNYKKPRPYKIGAFHFAVKYNVPIVPSFITFEDFIDKKGNKKTHFVLNILKPIYLKKDLAKKDNEIYLRDEAFNECKQCYESTYKTKLEYEKSEG